MLMAIFAITALGTGLGLLLGLASVVFAVDDENPLLIEVEQMLPGSQCGQCGFPGCRPAAQAVVEGKIGLNFCPPGGRALVEDLAHLLDIDPQSVGEVSKPLVAAIDDTRCVGCTKCLKACPTDAVVGANGQIHVVIAGACTGCKRCLQACPEDCILMREEADSLENWRWPKPAAA